MARGTRQATEPPTTQPRRVGNELPPYENPTFPLDRQRQRDLATLTQAHSLQKLEERFKDAQQILSTAAAEINDRLSMKERSTRKRKEREPEHPGNDEAEQSLNELRDKVERMTSRMDDSMRKLIDGQHNVQSIKDSIATSSERARDTAITHAQAREAASEVRRRRRSGDDESNGENNEGEQDDELPANIPPPGPTTIEVFRSEIDDAKTRYQSLSLTARYGENNTYRDFRRMVHDAKHGDDGVPLAYHTEWFEDGEAPAPGITTRPRRNGDADEEEDDDIAISRATISTKCVLTLQEFKSPLTSTKCNHSFETEAILSMLQTSTNREDNRPNGKKFVHCPVSGCSQTLTREDLHVDNVLVRKIHRIQRAKQLEAEDAEDNEEDEEEEHGNRRRSTQRRTVIVDDEEEADVDVDDTAKNRAGPSRTSGATAAPTHRIPSTQVMDLDESDEDETEDEDTMEE